MTVKVGDRVVIRQCKDGKLVATQSGTPKVGDFVTVDKNYVMSVHKSGTPKVGDKVVLVPNKDGFLTAIKSGAGVNTGLGWLVLNDFYGYSTSSTIKHNYPMYILKPGTGEVVGNIRSLPLGYDTTSNCKPSHIFTDTSARDAHFTAHHEELEQYLSIWVGGSLQRYIGTTWTSVSVAYTGPMPHYIGDGEFLLWGSLATVSSVNNRFRPFIINSIDYSPVIMGGVTNVLDIRNEELPYVITGSEVLFPNMDIDNQSSTGYELVDLGGISTTESITTTWDEEHPDRVVTCISNTHKFMFVKYSDHATYIDTATRFYHISKKSCYRNIEDPSEIIYNPNDRTTWGTIEVSYYPATYYDSSYTFHSKWTLQEGVYFSSTGSGIYEKDGFDVDFPAYLWLPDYSYPPNYVYGTFESTSSPYTYSLTVNGDTSFNSSWVYTAYIIQQERYAKWSIYDWWEDPRGGITARYFNDYYLSYHTDRSFTEIFPRLIRAKKYEFSLDDLFLLHQIVLQQINNIQILNLQHPLTYFDPPVPVKILVINNGVDREFDVTDLYTGQDSEDDYYPLSRRVSPIFIDSSHVISNLAIYIKDVNSTGSYCYYHVLNGTGQTLSQIDFEPPGTRTAVHFTGGYPLLGEYLGVEDPDKDIDGTIESLGISMLTGHYWDITNSLEKIIEFVGGIIPQKHQFESTTEWSTYHTAYPEDLVIGMIIYVKTNDQYLQYNGSSWNVYNPPGNEVYTVLVKHRFASTTARDAYFVTNPSELVEDLVVLAGGSTSWYYWSGSEWVVPVKHKIRGYPLLFQPIIEYTVDGCNLESTRFNF